MPPASSSIGEEISTPDEVKTYHDEVGDQGEEAPCERASNQVDLRDVKLGLVNERERENERSRHGERMRMSQADFTYRQNMFAQAQGLFGSLHNSSSPYGPYGPMGLSAFGGFSSVGPPQMGPMHLPRPIPVPAAGPFPFNSFTQAYSATPPGRSAHIGLAARDPSAAMQYGHASKMVSSPMAGSPSPAAFMLPNQHTPPPAHMGAGGRGLTCSPFATPHAAFPFHSLQSPEMMASWAYNLNQYRTNSPINPSMAPPFNLFNPFRGMASPMGMPPFSPQHFLPHSPDHNGRFSAHRHEVTSSRMSHADSSSSSTCSNRDHSEGRFHHRQPKREKHPSHVKKPLNAFMLYMKEMRASVQSECTLKESAAINQILGKRWHALDKTEQAKYYEMAKLERDNHAKNNPGWTAKDNYAQCGKKKRRKKEKSDEPKKCRAIFGIDRTVEWCKPCRRKKKCIRYIQNAALLANGGIDYIHEPKSSASDSMAHVSSSMQTLSPSVDSAASSTSPSSSAAASSG